MGIAGGGGGYISISGTNGGGGGGGVGPDGGTVVLPADIYQDRIAGNDANPGTALLPFKTWNKGVLKLIGQETTLTGAGGGLQTVVHSINGVDPSDPITLQNNVLGSGFTLGVITPSIVELTGAIGTWTTAVPDADQPNTLDDAAQDFSAHVGRMVVFTSGAATGVYGFIDDVSGDHNRVAQVSDLLQAVGPGGAIANGGRVALATAVPSNGDSYAILDFQTLRMGSCSIGGTDTNNLVFENCRFDGPEFTFPNIYSGQPFITVANSIVTAFFAVAGSTSQGGTFFVGSSFSGTMFLNGFLVMAGNAILPMPGNGFGVFVQPNGFLWADRVQFMGDGIGNSSSPVNLGVEFLFSAISSFKCNFLFGNVNGANAISPGLSPYFGTQGDNPWWGANNTSSMFLGNGPLVFSQISGDTSFHPPTVATSATTVIVTDTDDNPVQDPTVASAWDSADQAFTTLRTMTFAHLTAVDVAGGGFVTEQFIAGGLTAANGNMQRPDVGLFVSWQATHL